MSTMAHVRYVYEMVGGKAHGKFLVTNHEVRQWKVPMVQLLPGFYDMMDMGAPSLPETHEYVVTRPAAEMTVSGDILALPECEALCIAMAQKKSAYGELRIVR